MKFCQHCGAQLEANAKFCESCGARVEETVSMEEAEVTSVRKPGINTAGISKRNIVVAIILSIITCGIYNIYWTVKLNNELLQMSGKEGASGGMVILLSLLTCGIYTYYWYYKLGVYASTIEGKENDSSLSIVFILLAFFGLGFVNYIIAQSKINEHLDY